MPDFNVSPHGVDSSGRPILASAYLWNVWEAVVAELGFRPVITQGSWMSRVPGGGAEGSEGFHHKGGPFDLRTWNLTTAQVDKTVRVLREHGCAAWRRNLRRGGFKDPHIHFVCGTDRDLSAGAAAQWRAYIAGRDGLASNGPDYEARPDPLVLRPPEDDMPLNEADLEKVRVIVREEIAAAEDSVKYESPSGAQVAKRRFFEQWRKGDQ